MSGASSARPVQLCSRGRSGWIVGHGVVGEWLIGKGSALANQVDSALAELVNAKLHASLTANSTRSIADAVGRACQIGVAETWELELEPVAQLEARDARQVRRCHRRERRSLQPWRDLIWGNGCLHVGTDARTHPSPIRSGSATRAPVYGVYARQRLCRHPCRHPDRLRRSGSGSLVYNVYIKTFTYLLHARYACARYACAQGEGCISWKNRRHRRQPPNPLRCRRSQRYRPCDSPSTL